MNRDVTLRTYRPDDVAPQVQAVIESRVELTPWMPWCHDRYGEKDAREWIMTRDQAWRLGIEKSFVIAGQKGRILGGCGLQRIDPVNGVAEAGYWVRTTEVGRGVATWALGLLKLWAFQNGLQRIEMIISIENAASRRVAEKVGATQECVQPSRLLLQGRRHDAAVYVLTKPVS